MPTVGKTEVSLVLWTYFEIPKAIERSCFSTFGFVRVQVTRRLAQLEDQANSHQEPQTHDSCWLPVHRCIMIKTKTKFSISILGDKRLTIYKKNCILFQICMKISKQSFAIVHVLTLGN